MSQAVELMIYSYLRFVFGNSYLAKFDRPHFTLPKRPNSGVRLPVSWGNSFSFIYQSTILTQAEGKTDDPLQTRNLWSVLLALMLIVGCAPQSDTRAIQLSGDLPIDAPRVASIGERINVTIGPLAEVPDGTRIGLVTMSNYGPHTYNTTFRGGLARFVIPSRHTTLPGYVALIAAVDDARGEASVVLVQEFEGMASVSTPNERSP